jgi:hypothetical protein
VIACLFEAVYTPLITSGDCDSVFLQLQKQWSSGRARRQRGAAEIFDLRKGRQKGSICRARKSKRPSIPICTGDLCFHVVSCDSHRQLGPQVGAPDILVGGSCKGSGEPPPPPSAPTKLCPPEWPDLKGREFTPKQKQAGRPVTMCGGSRLQQTRARRTALLLIINRACACACAAGAEHESHKKGNL